MLYVCRWPAVQSNFEGNQIKLFRGTLDNPLAEAVYTGAVSQSVTGHVLPERRAPSMRHVKNFYVVVNILPFTDEEKESLGGTGPTPRIGWPRLDYLRDDTFLCSRAEIT